MIKQKWFCVECDSNGLVEMPDKTGVMSAIYLLHDDHEVVSPDCDNDVLNIQVINDLIGE